MSSFEMPISVAISSMEGSFRFFLVRASLAYLEQVVHIFIAGGEALDDAQDQAQISLYISLSGPLVTGLDLLEESFFLVRFQQGEL